MKTFVRIGMLIGLLMLLTLLAAACGGTPVTGPNQVHMNDDNFVQSSITIKKGEKITLVNDSGVIHNLENGYWDSNNTQRPTNEPGAPQEDAQIGGGGGLSVGPFNTAGTFHYYCSIHQGMTLTVIVK